MKLPRATRHFSDPGNARGDNRPVESVSRESCQNFCQKLTSHVGGWITVGLPSEAEWEHACRAGTTTEFHFGDIITPDLANYDGNGTWNGSPKGKFREETTNVGAFPANPWGLFDMHGNVWEWCQGRYGAYSTNAHIGSRQLTEESDEYGVARGGSWNDDPRNCTAACCYWDAAFRDFDCGFRCVFRVN